MTYIKCEKSFTLTAFNTPILSVKLMGQWQWKLAHFDDRFVLFQVHFLCVLRARSIDDSKINCEIWSATWRAISQHFHLQKAQLTTFSLFGIIGPAVKVGNHEAAACSRLTSLHDFWGLRSLNFQGLAAQCYWREELPCAATIRVCTLVLCMQFDAYSCTWGSWLFGCCRAEPQFNWADIRLWLILLMSAASRGEDTERKKCQTNNQVTSFIPPAAALPLCTHRKGFSGPLVPCWLHHCLLRLLSLLRGEFTFRENWEKTILAAGLIYKCAVGMDSGRKQGGQLLPIKTKC